MPRILAIEPDAARRATLGRLVSQHLTAEVVLAASAGDALLTLADIPPDVILTSTLLPADQDEQLAAHLRAAPDLDHLPVLTIPPVVEMTNPLSKPVGLWARMFRRRKREPFPPYDFTAITTRIEEALEESKHNANESEIERPARIFLLETRTNRLLTAGRGDSGTTALVRLGSEPPLPAEDGRQWRSRARRWHLDEVPWLSAVHVRWGASAFPTLRLLNISSTGLLVESDVHFTLGNKAGFQLFGADREDLIVQCSVVRADRMIERQSDQKYIVAATFDRPFDSLGRVRSLRELRRSGRLF